VAADPAALVNVTVTLPIVATLPVTGKETSAWNALPAVWPP